MKSLETALAGANNSSSVATNGGDVALEIRGTWGGATAKVYYSSDGGTTFAPISGAINPADGVPADLAITADSLVGFNVPKGHWRVTTSDGTDSSLVVNYCESVNSRWNISQ